MNESQTDYCDFFLKGIYSQNARNTSCSPAEYAEKTYTKPPKVKYKDDSPHIFYNLI